MGFGSRCAAAEADRGTAMSPAHVSQNADTVEVSNTRCYLVGSSKGRKSPLRRAIEKYTLHPDSPETRACPPGRSKLLHWIHVVTQHPSLAIPSEVKSDTGLPVQSFGVVLAGFCAAALLTVASGTVARKLPAVQAAFQGKWSQLETVLQASLSAGQHQAGRAAKFIGSKHHPVTNLAKRVMPLAAVAIAATAFSNTTGKEATQAAKDSFCTAGPSSSSKRITRVLHCCLAIAGCSAAQCAVTHKQSLGVKDPYKVARSRVQSTAKYTSHACASRCTALLSERYLNHVQHNPFSKPCSISSSGFFRNPMSAISDTFPF